MRMALTSMRTRSRWLAFISLMMSKMASGVSSAFWESFFSRTAWDREGVQHSLCMMSHSSACSCLVR